MSVRVAMGNKGCQGEGESWRSGGMAELTLPFMSVPCNASLGGLGFILLKKVTCLHRFGSCSSFLPVFTTQVIQKEFRLNLTF